MPPNPACFATATHWLQSSAVGLKISSVSVPSPHSSPVNVFGPKWQNIFISIRCHATCAAVGTGPYGAGGAAGFGFGANFCAWTASPSKQSNRIKQDFLILTRNFGAKMQKISIALSMGRGKFVHLRFETVKKTKRERPLQTSPINHLTS